MDLGRWPVAVAVFPADVTPEGLDSHFDDIARLLDRGEPFAVAIDMRASAMATAKLRAQAARRLREAYRHANRDKLVAVAHVVDSALVRGLLTAVYWLAPPPFVTEVFPDQAAALLWLRTKLARPAAGRSESPADR
jgi:hypothetical protein